MGAVNYDATIMPRGVIVPTTIVISQMTSAGVAVSTSPICITAGNIFKISITVSLTEPLLFLSPFAGLTQSQDDACLLGNIICNIRSNLGGLFKTSKPYNYAVSLF